MLCVNTFILNYAQYLKNAFGFEFPKKILNISYFGQILSFEQIQKLAISWEFPINSLAIKLTVKLCF